MYKSVMVYTNINKRTKINNISDSTGYFHSGFQILKLQNITSQKWWRKLITYITSRF